MTFQVKRAYDRPDPKDGPRVLVDRLWPRGVRKEDAAIDLWAKEMAPSKDLREWFGHDPDKWDGFKDRYFKELRRNPSPWRALLEKARHGRVTLVYAAKDEDHNNAVALLEFLQDPPESE